MSGPDKLDARARSTLMAKIRSRDTSPELRVRKAAHAAGLRFRLHRRDLPGTPDLILPRHRLAIFVHGCFWHRHPGCRRASLPATRTEFWEAKFARNVERDRTAMAALSDLGWLTLVIWECDTHNPASISSLILRQCRPPRGPDG